MRSTIKLLKDINLIYCESTSRLARPRVAQALLFFSSLKELVRATNRRDRTQDWYTAFDESEARLPRRLGYRL
jgi:hypothetical protein